MWIPIRIQAAAPSISWPGARLTGARSISGSLDQKSSSRLDVRRPGASWRRTGTCWAQWPTLTRSSSIRGPSTSGKTRRYSGARGRDMFTGCLSHPPTSTMTPRPSTSWTTSSIGASVTDWTLPFLHHTENTDWYENITFSFCKQALVPRGHSVICTSDVLTSDNWTTDVLTSDVLITDV